MEAKSASWKIVEEIFDVTTVHHWRFDTPAGILQISRYTWNLLTSWYFMPLHSNISKANSWRTFTFFKEVEWLSYEEIFSFTTPFSPQVWVTFLAMTLGTGSPIARIVMSECRSGGATEFKWIWWDRTQRRYITWFGDIWWTARIKEGRCCEGALPSCIVRRRID